VPGQALLLLDMLLGRSSRLCGQHQAAVYATRWMHSARGAHVLAAACFPNCADATRGLSAPHATPRRPIRMHYQTCVVTCIVRALCCTCGWRGLLDGWLHQPGRHEGHVQSQTRELQTQVMFKVFTAAGRIC
jgi:hypothetical protein